MNLSSDGNSNIAIPQELGDLKSHIECETGINIVLKKLDDSFLYAAKYDYIDGSDIFTISLKENCEKVHLAHELIHAEILFILNFICLRETSEKWKHPCFLINMWMQDFVIHRKIMDYFNIAPFDSSYLTKIGKFAEDLRQGGRIWNDYERKEGQLCENLYIAFEALQVYDFYHSYGAVCKSGQETNFNKFIIYFEKSKSMPAQILNIYNELKDIYKITNFNERESYKKSLKRVCQIDKLEINTEKLIDNVRSFYYVKQGNGFHPKY